MSSEPGYRKPLYGSCITQENSVRKISVALRDREAFGDFKCTVELVRDAWWTCYQIAEDRGLEPMDEPELHASMTNTRELTIRTASSALLELSAFFWSQKQERPNFTPNFAMTRKFLGFVRFLYEKMGLYDEMEVHNVKEARTNDERTSTSTSTQERCTSGQESVSR